MLLKVQKIVFYLISDSLIYKHSILSLFECDIVETEVYKTYIPRFQEILNSFICYHCSNLTVEISWYRNPYKIIYFLS